MRSAFFKHSKPSLAMIDLKEIKVDGDSNNDILPSKVWEIIFSYFESNLSDFQRIVTWNPSIIFNYLLNTQELRGLTTLNHQDQQYFDVLVKKTEKERLQAALNKINQMCKDIASTLPDRRTCVLSGSICALSSMPVLAVLLYFAVSFFTNAARVESEQKSLINYYFASDLNSLFNRCYDGNFDHFSVSLKECYNLNPYRFDQYAPSICEFICKNLFYDVYQKKVGASFITIMGIFVFAGICTAAGFAIACKRPTEAKDLEKKRIHRVVDDKALINTLSILLKREPDEINNSFVKEIISQLTEKLAEIDAWLNQKQANIDSSIQNRLFNHSTSQQKTPITITEVKDEVPSPSL